MQRVDENVAQAKLDGDGETVMNVTGIVAAVRDKIDEPYIDLSGEYWALQNYPKEELQHGETRRLRISSSSTPTTSLTRTRGRAMTWCGSMSGAATR